MYLKEIVANGFKSFADRTRIELRPGVTAVVGPNGCGKSNIVDAIRWVLGEQSAKSLRAPAMQDVIFAGTDRRKPLPQCEVELIFADCEKELGTAFAEVSVMRRLHREGASDYFINGKPSRLKDIQRLFMDTGIGRMSYSFMVQGQIDQILSANPAERRYLFEEAAGITRYKAQRREALNKLGGVDTNLARITDVVSEVGRQIATLRRQAAKALRFRRLRHRFTHLDLAWHAKQFGDRRAQVTALETDATACRTEVTALTDGLRDREAALLQMRARRTELAEQVQLAQQALFELRTARENAENEARTSDLRSDDLSSRLGEVRREAQETELSLAEYEMRLRGSSDAKSTAAGSVSATDAAYREKTAQVEEVARQVVEAENLLRRARQDILIAEGEMTRARGDVTNLEVDLRGYQSRHVDLSASLSQAKQEREAHERRVTECGAVVTTRHGELQTARTAEQEATEKGRDLLNDFRALQQTISEQDRKVAKLSAQLGLLEQMQSRLEGFSEAAKAVLRGEFSEELRTGKASALADLVTVVDISAAAALENILSPPPPRSRTFSVPPPKPSPSTPPNSCQALSPRWANASWAAQFSRSKLHPLPAPAPLLRAGSVPPPPPCRRSLRPTPASSRIFSTDATSARPSAISSAGGALIRASNSSSSQRPMATSSTVAASSMLASPVRLLPMQARVSSPAKARFAPFAPAWSPRTIS